jgi:HCOMODA/2-hydroxy-3-carboxy-muconic semialdehyde decarboxylase
MTDAEESAAHAETEVCVRKTARALVRNGLGNAFGHVSSRLDPGAFLVCASKAMNTILPGDPGTVVPVEGALPDGVLGEVRVHQQIYQRRPDVGGIVRTFLPNTLTLSAMGRTPRARHGFGTYFAPAPPIWMETELLRDDAKAAAVAEMLADARAIVLRGNGSVITGATVEEALVMAYFLESAATVELAVLAAGERVEDFEYTAEQATNRAVTSGGVVERKWAYLTWGDPE